jgi:hypothetical protein
MRVRRHREPDPQAPGPGRPMPGRRRPPRRAGGGEHLAERRMRDSGGPEDRASYTCSCGFVWEAEVSTSVRCPHCGAGQAW